MRKMKKLFLAMLAVAMIAGLFSGRPTAAFAETKYPGLDVVIVIDFSFSTFPGINNGEADTELMCLDAAAMLINMCDSTYSKVAIVPFTDGQPLIENYNMGNGNLWNTWVDASDSRQRKALCDSLFVPEMYKAGNSRIHQGNTNYALGMQQALDLVRASTTGNQKLVLVLGDGKSQPASEENESAAINSAREIESFNGRIYCLQFGNDENGRRLLRSIATSDATYWSNVQPSELKDHFSGVFAELIGTEQETVFSQTIEETNEEVFNIAIPHKAISEVNVVIDINRIAGDVTVLDGNGNVASDGDNLLRYINRNSVSHKYEAYDFVSIKIIDPMPGVWKAIVSRAGSVPPGEPMTIDLLYNYEIELAAGLSGVDNNAFKKNESVAIESYFIDANGNPSDDYTLYTGRQADGSGIEAVLTVYNEAGDAVLQEPMTADYEGHRFVATIDLNSAGFVNKNTTDDQAFRYSVSASGDHMFRETQSFGTFYVYGEKPIRLTEEPVFLGTIRVNDIFSGGGEPGHLFSEPMTSYFADGDGDVLSYQISESSLLDCGIGERDGQMVLGVGSLGDENVNGGYVDVYAMDGAGNRSEPVRFVANVIAVDKLVEDCVTVKAVPDPDIVLGEGRLKKGQSTSVSVEYEIIPPTADFPYNSLSELVSDEAVGAALTVTHVPAEMPEDAVFDQEDGGRAFTVKAGRRTGRIQIDSTADINGIKKEVGSTVFEVVNTPPAIVPTLDAALVEAGALAREIPAFQVDRDNADPARLSFDLDRWFEDGDGEYDSLRYTATVEALPETRDIFTPARAILRAISLIPRDGDIVTVDADQETGALGGSALNLTAARFGNARVTVVAADEDGASVSHTVDYGIASSKERLMCIITYAVMLVLLAVISGILINKLVVHRPWPRRNDEYRVIQNGFDVLTETGAESRRFGRTGRKPCRLKALADHFDIADDGNGADAFSKVVLWPTTGNRIVVELKRGVHLAAGTGVKVDGTDIARGRKVCWRRNGRIVVTYSDNSGYDNECVFKRD